MTADQLLRISVLDGAFALVRHAAAYPTITIPEAVQQLRSGPSNVAALDYDRAQVTLDRFGRTLFVSGGYRQADLRRVIHEIAVVTRPLWALAAPFGRSRSREAMPEDAAQCLEYAGLFDEPPGPASVLWWDRLASMFRADRGQERMLAGREGEALTVQYEKERLASIGLQDLHPRWVAIDDSAAGYDVLSWDRDSGGSVHELRIEAKAYSSLEARFYLSRNEWETARLFSPRYAVYVWNLDTRGLSRIMGVNELERHIPTDKGLGKWDAVRIRL